MLKCLSPALPKGERVKKLTWIEYPLLLLFTFTSLLNCYAQENLTLDNAIEIALKNNYAIAIAKATTSIAANNNTYGNAGFLPQVSLNASGSLSSVNTKQEYASGLKIDRQGVSSNNINSGVSLNWTIFDGFRMFATKEKLNELQAQGELNLKMEIENNLSGIIIAYYNIVRQQQLIKAMYESVKVSEERIRIAQKKTEIGSASKLDLLQAKVDLNTQRSAILKLKTDLSNAKASLNLLLARSNEADFIVADSIPLNFKVSYNDLKTSVPKLNDSLLYAQKNILISQKVLKEVNALRLPQIGINTTYNFSKTNNQVGFALINQNLGWNGGLSIYWNLFNAFKTNILYRNAQQQTMITKYQFDQTQKQVETSLLKAWNNYQNSLEALLLEEENSAVAKENLAVALERFRIGNATNVDMNLAQKSFEDAASRRLSARYDAKVAETTLMKLNGELVK
ncbi:MAG: TolC family protein [Bacteroidetes bacterium]|nr:TolC family protein [Bacteroidota bacterium]